MKNPVLACCLMALLAACASPPLSSVSKDYRAQMTEVCQQHYLKKGVAAEKVTSGCDSSLGKYLDKIDEAFEQRKAKYQRRCRSESSMSECMHQAEERHWQRYKEKYQDYISRK